MTFWKLDCFYGVGGFTRSTNLIKSKSKEVWEQLFLKVFFIMWHKLYLGLSKIFEEHLKRLNPGQAQITYDISQLFDFIDQLTDLSCLV